MTTLRSRFRDRDPDELLRLLDHVEAALEIPI
jgi:hypothetical protein